MTHKDLEPRIQKYINEVSEKNDLRQNDAIRIRSHSERFIAKLIQSVFAITDRLDDLEKPQDNIGTKHIGLFERVRELERAVYITSQPQNNATQETCDLKLPQVRLAHDFTPKQMD